MPASLGRFSRFTLLAIAVLIAVVPAMEAQIGSAPEPVGRIDGQVIYQQDLLPSIGLRLLQLRNDEYEAKLKAFKELANQRLLEHAAKSKGLSKEAFLQETVDRHISYPDASEIQAFYQERRDLFNQPFGDLKPQLERAVMEAKRQKARQQYVDSLYDNPAVSILLRRPQSPVDPDPSRLRGEAGAPISIVEFADFQCPYCRAVEQTLMKVMEKYRGKVRIGFRDFPVRQIHPDAEGAAQAARCAGDQGKFWEYHDLLLANQVRLDQNNLREYARTAGLEVERFAGCIASGTFAAAVEKDVQAGLNSGVSATPTFFINGNSIVGDQPLSIFETVIDAELAAASMENRAR
jgi:protein-disulfide isomerase